MKLKVIKYKIETDDPEYRDIFIESRGPKAWVIFEMGDE